MAALFEPYTLRSVTLRNRIVVSPMCEYSSIDGFANNWHLVHLGSRAVGGAGLVFTEATAVVPEGRISPADLGIYKDEHVPKLAEIVAFVHERGALAGIQLAHAGRKASVSPPWDGGRPLGLVEGGWQPIVAPSAIPFYEDGIVPRELNIDEIRSVVGAFARATERALEAGFRVIEIHAAHGYLIHEFYSPLSNARADQYGGSFANRTRLLREVVTAVRKVWPERLSLFVRISSSDWLEGGWTIDDSVQLARDLSPLGVDLIDCSSGGISPSVQIPMTPGYQVPFAEQIRKEAQIATGAVGLIVDANQAETILTSGQADLIVMARLLLRDPYWPLRAAQALGVDIPWPVQYDRAKAPPPAMSAPSRATASPQP